MFWPAFLLFGLSLAKPLVERADSAPSVRQIAQFANLTWIENIIVRSNGKLLVTLFTSPDLYQIDPQHDPTPKLVAEFPGVLGILGITELEEDVFAISAGNVSLATATITPNSFSVFKADLRNRETAEVSKIADLPDAIFLNGVTTISDTSDYLLIADSIAGLIWRLNIQTAEYDIFLNQTETQLAKDFLEGGFAANGVHTRDGFLYFTNSDKGFFRIAVNDDGTKAGEVETVTPFLGSDDFTFDRTGNAYIALGRFDEFYKIAPNGTIVSTINSPPVLLAGVTAAAFGRKSCDKSTLYVTTNGGQTGQVNGTAIEGGRVLAIDGLLN